MKVLKFGGTSVGTPEAMLQVKEIVKSGQDNKIVVVSALAGITDALMCTARMALQGNILYTEELDGIKSRHISQLRSVVETANREIVEAKLLEMLAELSDIFNGIFLVGDLSVKTTDTVLSYGERLACLILGAVIEDSVYYDARKFIKTKTLYGKHTVDFPETEELIRETFGTMPRIAIVPGFIASDLQTSVTTTLGRGGSDYTASVLAAALDATELEIWTDVDGFMTADPKVVPNAYVIERLTYTEATELCNFGAKVIYPPTIFPAYHNNIPIRIRNTFNPISPGTYISHEPSPASKSSIKGISSVAESCLVTVQGLGMVGIIGVNYRIFKALAKAGISVFLVSQAASENNTSIGVKESDSVKAVEALTEEFSLEISQGEIHGIIRECGLATVAIVGQEMQHRPGVAGKLFGTLGRNGINVKACAQGASEMNISFVIDLSSLNKAMNVIHDSFFLSDYQVMNIFIAGIGLVGSNLIEQIRLQQEKLMNENSLQIRIAGISNSRKFVMDAGGIDLSRYGELLAGSAVESSPEKYKEEIIEMNLFNSVFVDCTASGDVAGLYESLLEHNISVVTANKIAASSSYAVYENLKRISRRNGVKFLFETNVGAGLPVINTIGDLRNSGDRIIKIEAVVSGTLNFIFNALDSDVPFSRTIRMAQEAGFAEPDPRIDLSGTDVVRKLVILSREAGYQLEQEDVTRELFVPAEYFEGTLEDFWKNITKLDEDFEIRRQRMQAKGLRWRFIAVFDNGTAKVGLREVGSDSPFYDLAGSNNVISLTTERYREYPMQIKGYGAGATVTAAGVFADIISIANIR